MEERIASLESRIEKLEKELRLILRHLNLPDTKEGAFELQDDEAALIRAYEVEAAEGEPRVKIYKIRSRLGWEKERFEPLLETLAEQKRIQLHPADVSSLSLKQIDDSYMSEDGDLFSEIFIP